jgi:ribosomal protein S12 methylthiotransferase
MPKTLPSTRVYLASLGCARNQIDSEGMAGRLQQSGAVVVDDPEQAEAIVVNTCSFIEAAADESIDTILQLAQLKQTGACRRLIVTGCLPERYRDEIAGAIPEVDLFLGTGAFDRIAAAVAGTLGPARCLLPDPDRLPPAGADDPRARNASAMAYLKIAEGCSRHCTYCIIPKLRGRQKSRRPQDIVAEARRLLAAGVKELVLVSQETTAYGQDFKGGGAGLARLLESLAELRAGAQQRCPADAPADFWIRFLYGHPESIADAVIQTVAKHTNLCEYFDIPIQHAADGVLKKMGRRYSRDDLRRLIDRIRETMPGAAVRTTVIVGFPGETEKDFQTLLRFVEQVRFDHLGCFTYSDAEDLASHRLADPVAPAVAEERMDAIMTCQAGISADNNRRYLDRSLPVLVEHRMERGLYACRSSFQAPEVDGVTLVRAETLPTGCFQRVRITETQAYDLTGVPL